MASPSFDLTIVSSINKTYLKPSPLLRPFEHEYEKAGCEKTWVAGFENS
jgi:hypothetical protein